MAAQPDAAAPGLLGVTRDALDHAFGALGLRDNDDLKNRLMDAYLSLDAYPDVAPAAGGASPGWVSYRQYCSNGTPAMLKAGVESAGIGDSLDAVLSIEDVGIYKPHPSVYQLACDRLGLERNRICFVSSNGWDIAGAATFGFQTVWLNRFWPEHDRLPGEPPLVLRTSRRAPGADHARRPLTFFRFPMVADAFRHPADLRRCGGRRPPIWPATPS